MKKIAILGSTGSIGTQALDVIAHHPDRFCVTVLSCSRKIDRLSPADRGVPSPDGGC